MKWIEWAFALLTAASAGCVVQPDGTLISPLQAELDANRAKWSALGGDNYEYAFGNGCNCPPEITAGAIITVRNGGVTGLRRIADDVEFEPLEGGRYPTIEELFDTIQQGIDGADAMSVRFDEELGYPTSIYVDWSAGTADEETSYSASDMVLQ